MSLNQSHFGTFEQVLDPRNVEVPPSPRASERPSGFGFSQSEIVCDESELASIVFDPSAGTSNRPTQPAEDASGENGYLAVEVSRENLKAEAEELDKRFGVFGRTVKKGLGPGAPSRRGVRLGSNVRFPASPAGFPLRGAGGVEWDCLNIPCIFDRNRTGFEESKEFPIVIGAEVAGRFEIIEFLGAAGFSKAVHAKEIHSGKSVCLKIVENNKDFFDQALDEIRILRLLAANGSPSANRVVSLIEFFYHREHLFIVTELLKDNLYEYSRFNREQENELFFTIPRVQKVAKEILKALEFAHSLSIIHCDLKPDNILVRSYSKEQYVLIDFGSASFSHDHQSFYIQSRFYRAPEVLLGCPYDSKIDIWSLGCVLYELAVGEALFETESPAALLAKVAGVFGPFPDHMLKHKQASKLLFEGKLFVEPQRESEQSAVAYVPLSFKLESKIRPFDGGFVEFLKTILSVDPAKRPTATEALKHPWLFCDY